LQWIKYSYLKIKKSELPVEMQAANIPFDFAQGTEHRWLSEAEATKGDNQ